MVHLRVTFVTKNAETAKGMGTSWKYLYKLYNPSDRPSSKKAGKYNSCAHSTNPEGPRGARPLRRVIQRTIEDALSEKLIAGEIHLGESVQMTVKDGNIAFEQAAVADPK